ncbi:hypothetical protein MMC25_007744 [Agyrium rufum]|nr:hypothetical protein [Agyrium rufum]
MTDSVQIADSLDARFENNVGAEHWRDACWDTDFGFEVSTSGSGLRQDLHKCLGLRSPYLNSPPPKPNCAVVPSITSPKAYDDAEALMTDFNIRRTSSSSSSNDFPTDSGMFPDVDSLDEQSSNPAFRDSYFPNVGQEPIRRPLRQNRKDMTWTRTKQGKVTKRKQHSEVERKYRESINEKLECLRNVVPNLAKAELDVMGEGRRLSKATVLDCACAYIEKTDGELVQMKVENQRLRMHNYRIRKFCRGMQERMLCSFDEVPPKVRELEDDCRPPSALFPDYDNL